MNITGLPETFNNENQEKHREKCSLLSCFYRFFGTEDCRVDIGEMKINGCF